MNPQTIEFSSQLRILLLIFTIISFFIYYIGSNMGVFKAILLILIYLLFTSYIVGESLDSEWSNNISTYLNTIYHTIK